jgi:molecular chaperone HscB
MHAEWGKNYFELFGLPAGFDIDPEDLAARYRELQRRVHPDRFASASDPERRLSMQMTTLVNEAYQTLKNPVRRGRYLLGLQGVPLDDETDTAMAPEFLMEQMELRETLDAARAREDAHRRLAELAHDIAGRFAAKTREFRGYLDQGAAGQVPARNAVREMQFLEKLLSEIRDLEEELS